MRVMVKTDSMQTVYAVPNACTFPTFFLNQDMRTRLSDLEETMMFGEALCKSSKPGDVIFLVGELGAGKTSACRGFLRYFTGNNEMDVPSPSYLISLEYYSAKQPNVKVYHLDPYRLSPGNVACLVDFEKAVCDDILLIEWPSRLGDKLTSLVMERARRQITVTFGGIGPQAVGREVEISSRGSAEDIEWINEVSRTWIDLVQGSHRNPSKQPRTSSSDLPETLPSGDVRADGDELLVMGIESSCDDTAVAILKGDGSIVAQCIASQASVHSEWGGVVPKLAQEEHAKAIQGTVDACMQKAGISADSLSAIAVTVGPGLALCLLVGVKKAMELSSKNHVPLVRVHHMEGHMMVTRLPGVCSEVPQFPFVTLLVSGGHTMIVLTRDLGDHTILGSTIDDSVGEAFDKTARLLGITAVPGGKELEALASGGVVENWKPPLPKPLSKTRDDSLRKGCDMSFAGLKTAVQLALASAQKRSVEYGEEINKKDLAAAFQKCCADHLADRLKRALRIILTGDNDNPPLVESGLRHVVVAGGVAANEAVKCAVNQVAEEFGLVVCAPPPRLCADNGVMIAWTGIERLRRGLGEPALKLDCNEDIERFCEVRPRWPLGLRHSACLGKLNDQNLRSLDRKAKDLARSKAEL